ncbi:hypothetical protein ACVINI_005791 [Rhizobium beringeri]
MGVAINAHLFLDLRPEILDQMKTVSHLAGLRCALPGCLGIQATAISANDLDGRTFSQPCFCALDAAVVQNIDDRMTLEIDHDRAVPRGMPPAPIINAHDPNIVFFMDAGLSRFDCRKTVVADRHAEPMHEVFTRATAHPVANQAHYLSHPFRSSHVGRSNLGQPVGEGPSPAFSVSTLPPVQCEVDFHNLTPNRQVLEAAVMPAVPMPASRSAIRADTDRFCSGRNSPVFCILKGETQNFDPWAGRLFYFNFVRIPADSNRGANTLLTTEIEEEPLKLRIRAAGFSD